MCKNSAFLKIKILFNFFSDSGSFGFYQNLIQLIPKPLVQDNLFKKLRNKEIEFKFETDSMFSKS
jgi:hypothetical protein